MKQTITIILILFSSFLTYAQTSSRISYSLKGGLNFADAEFSTSLQVPGIGLNATIDIDTKIRTSIYIGGIIEFRLENPKSYLQLELLYSEIGTVIKETDSYNETEFKISQLTIPILFKYDIYKNLSLYGGSYIGYILKVKEEKLDVTDDYNTLDFGLILGTQFDFENGLFIEARYNYSLSNILKPIVISGTVIEAEFKNRVLQLGVGYKF